MPGRNPTILGPNGRPYQTATLRVPVRSKYDAASTDTENSRHWSNADSLSSRAANDPATRRKLRERSRYEIANNSYARGIINTLANDTIGTGPRLQLLTDDDTLNREIESEFLQWSDAVNLGDKLRVMCKAAHGDGEAFAVLSTNEMLPTPAQLDLLLIESEQVAQPWLGFDDPTQSDGITFDKWGNPRAYNVLRDHPGDSGGLTWFGASDLVSGRLMLHWFRKDRPRQVRGIPSITPALPLFALLRRFTLATVTAAETAANFAAMLESALAPDADPLDGEPFETLDIERGMMTTLPAGWKMSQLKAEHPATTYEMFKKEVLNEIARCLSMPFNVAAGNSSSYNYASGRLDWQVYFKSLRVEQTFVELSLLDRIFGQWLDEMWLASDLLPEPPGRLGGWPHQWFWDGAEHVDPLKEATAQKTRLETRTTSYAFEYSRQGRDWEAEFVQIAKEQTRMAELGIAVAAPAASGFAPIDPNAADTDPNAPEAANVQQG